MIHEEDASSVFYLNYLDYEHLQAEGSDPHERLNCFYLAIVEAAGKKDYEKAYDVYQDLLAKKEAFFVEGYPFEEEIFDLQQEIVHTLSSCGLKASLEDFSCELAYL